MKNYYSVGQAAKAVGMTSETLRHYDRIGLVKPSRKDDWTNYRYYTEQDLVRLNTVHALQQMDLPLQKIKEVLEYDDLAKIVDFLTEAEKRADEKIASIKQSKAKIKAAKTDYEKKMHVQQRAEDFFIESFPQRVIMLSDTMETPGLDNLWNYLKHFYDKIAPSDRELFEFADLAGVYTEKNFSRMFAVCIRYEEFDGLKILPAGKYLCIDCDEENRKSALDKLIRTAADKYGAEPNFAVQMIVISGILQWRYQIQMLIEEIDNKR